MEQLYISETLIINSFYDSDVNKTDIVCKKNIIVIMASNNDGVITVLICLVSAKVGEFIQCIKKRNYSHLKAVLFMLTIILAFGAGWILLIRLVES